MAGKIMTGFINPTREQFKAIFGLPLDAPVHMLNLLRFNPSARYAPEDLEAGAETITGRAAYEKYSQEATPAFAAAGGKQVWIAAPELMLIGPAEETWDLAFVAFYPTAQAFVDMVRNPDYQRATRHRTAAVADSRLIRCAPARPGTTFWPGT
jgi:uncharacterized protein (DUF1330 family)